MIITGLVGRDKLGRALPFELSIAFKGPCDCTIGAAALLTTRGCFGLSEDEDDDDDPALEQVGPSAESCNNNPPGNEETFDESC